MSACHSSNAAVQNSISDAGITQIPSQPPQSGITNEPASQALPVRVPRSFFQEQVLIGTVRAVTPQTQFDSQIQSPISWVEEPTEQPAPRQGVLADFRDHPGCALYQDIDGAGVCFNMMGDVYSLGVNSKEVELRGINQWIAQELAASPQSSDCAYEVQNLEFNQATRSDDQLTIQYRGELVSQQPNCKTPREKIEVQFQLKKI
jgi:hypothetical protein